MHINNLPVRYVGEHIGANYAAHTRPFLSVRAAVEYLADTMTCPGDSVVLWPVSAHDSEAEIYGRAGDTADASHLIEIGPRYGVNVTRL